MLDDLWKLAEKGVTEMTVEELVKVHQLPGADDYAGPELAQRGAPAQSQILALLKDDQTPLPERLMIVQILYLYFDPPAFEDELLSIVDRLNDDEAKAQLEQAIALFRRSRKGSP